MTATRGTSRVRTLGTRNLTRVVVPVLLSVLTAGIAPVALAGTAQAATPSSGHAYAASGDDVWDRIAQCESGGRWNTNTGNGYSGGLQFSPSTWRAYGGHGSPHGASRTEQISVAKRVQAAQGWGAWPSCSRKAGVRGSSAGSRHHSSGYGSRHSLEASATRTTSHLVKRHHGD